ncbi:hypothetical protein ABZ353_10875 [Streptomyces niveus]|uniref:hypothetical protein n=1 Tax=Streptomyces niveus TaxID=193462 RepID=UPI0033D20985
MSTRTFTVDQLAELGVPWECGTWVGSAEELHNELYDTTRWAHVYEFVFRHPDDGKAYRVFYWCGATEHQDQDLWDWAHEVRAAEVEEVQVTVSEWKPVKESK